MGLREVYMEGDMTKRLTILLVIVLLIAACGSSTKEDSMPPTSADTPAPAPTATAVATQTAVSQPKVETATVIPPTPALQAKLEGGAGPVYSLAWSPDGKMLAAAGYGEQ